MPASMGPGAGGRKSVGRGPRVADTIAGGCGMSAGACAGRIPTRGRRRDPAGGPAGPRSRGGPRRGSDVQARIQIDIKSAFAGSRERITLRDPAQGERTLEVKIPAGIEPGRQIRLNGQGNPGAAGGPAGDLLLEVAFHDDPRFRLDGRNIVCVLPVSPWEAALGATVTVPTLAGEVELRVPPGSDSGRKLRLRGRGWPGKETGDQIVVLEVHAPAAETDEQKKVYESMAKVFAFNPRT